MTGKPQDSYDIYYIGQKNSTKRRLIQQPSTELKELQRDLISLYEHFPLHQACSCKKGSGPIDAALPHLGAKYLLKIDLSDCYQHISIEQAYETIQNDFPDGTEKEEMLVNLPNCFIYWNGKTMLPTGAPTSPMLCNMVLSAIDDSVMRIANEYGYRYTRYMDDLNLSTTAETRDWKLIDIIKNILREAGFSINQKKTRWYGRGNNDAKIVAGVSLESISRRQVKRLIRARLQNLAVNRTPIDSVTNGYLAYIKSIDEETYARLRGYYQKRLEYQRSSL
tara:strand:- start:479 stop:1315 length:837 start_codon:yes stop_codon:yes gene_type:complete